MTEMTLLHPGDRSPALTVALPGGRAPRLPDALAARFSVVLFYRGWCACATRSTQARCCSARCT
jgi:hypothetical protein